MKKNLALAAVLITIASLAGCKREEPKPAASPPPPAAATPPATPPAGGTLPATPNPPAVTGVDPVPPATPPDAGPAERAGRAIGEQIDDAAITAKVKAALLQAPDVKGSDVNVQTEKSVVQLSGFVRTQTEIERAVAIARAVNGVKEVHNKMSLKSGQ